MSIEVTAPHSRRALLAAAAGAAAATLVSAMDHPGVVRGGADGDVVLGAKNTATQTTEIESAADLGRRARRPQHRRRCRPRR